MYRFQNSHTHSEIGLDRISELCTSNAWWIKSIELRFFYGIVTFILFTLLGMISPHNDLPWLMDEVIEWRINKHWYVGASYNFKGSELYGRIGVYVKCCKTCPYAAFVTIWMCINQSISCTEHHFLHSCHCQHGTHHLFFVTLFH
jgi:hypothetical protein